MNFDEYIQSLQIEDFTDILKFEGKIFGDTKLNITLDELMKNLKQYKDKFNKAQGCCLCLSQDISQFENDTIKQIYGLIENIDIYFIKPNPDLATNKSLYSYSLLLTGL